MHFLCFAEPLDGLYDMGVKVFGYPFVALGCGMNSIRLVKLGVTSHVLQKEGHKHHLVFMGDPWIDGGKRLDVFGPQIGQHFYAR